METSAAASIQPSPRETLDSVVIRFAGDSGDGMQLTGSQFTTATADAGNDLATFPDFPAEIRAPAGTTYGVSGYQIHFAAHDVLTPGDEGWSKEEIELPGIGTVYRLRAGPFATRAKASQLCAELKAKQQD